MKEHLAESKYDSLKRLAAIQREPAYEADHVYDKENDLHHDFYGDTRRSIHLPGVEGRFF